MKTRIITGFLLGIVILSFLFVGSHALSLLLIALSYLGFREFLSMAKSPLPFWMSVVFVMIMSTFYFIPVHDLTYWLFFPFVFLIYSTFSKEASVEKIAFMLFGFFYVSFGFYSVHAVRELDGLFVTLWVMSMIWSTDSFAYFVGMKWGKRKLAPAISPKKSIEGAIGGVIGCLLISLPFLSYVETKFTPFSFVLLTVGSSMLVQLGDLAESSIKRHFDVKDSGTILPGHGGILDRFDSLLFVFPFVYLFM